MNLFDGFTGFRGSTRQPLYGLGCVLPGVFSSAELLQGADAVQPLA